MMKRWLDGFRMLPLLAVLMLVLTAPLAGETSERSLDALRINTLARQGEFQQLAQLLTASNLPTSPTRARLLEALDRYQHNLATRQDVRQRGLERHMDRMTARMDEQAWEEAMVSAIEAVDLAQDRQAFLEQAQIQTLVQAVTAQAEQAMDQSSFLRAMSLYRLLELLHENNTDFRQAYQGAARQLRIVQFYAPDAFKTMVDAERERRRGQQSDERTPAMTADPEPWEERLSGVEIGMLQQALFQARRFHIDSPTFNTMLKGAIDSLKLVIETPSLRDVFPLLANDQRRQRMESFLQSLVSNLDQRQEDLSARDALEMVDRILQMNRLTVDLPEAVVVYELTQGFTDTLDEFTTVIWPEDIERFNRTTQGRFFGVGIQISRRHGRLVVVTPLANTPAMGAGIKAGDIIATVDGRDTAAWSLDRAVREITGPEGEEVVLGIERRGHTDLIAFPLRRAEIPIESIRGWQHTEATTWDYLIDPDERIAYIRLTQFIPQSADDLDQAIATISQEHGALRGLILDLRSNPGGLLSSAVDIADRFVDQGLIVSTVDRERQPTKRHMARLQATYPDMPVVILINQASASASEIVSGALQDYGRAVIIGHRTFGKGSVQDLYPLDRGRSFLKLTTQQYMLPEGRIIDRETAGDRWGIEPDLVIAMADRELVQMNEYRNEMDIFRDASAPEAIADVVEVTDEDAPKDPDRLAFEKLLKEGSVGDILARGLDPQLEAALIVMRAHLLSRELTGSLARSRPAAASTP